MVRDNPAPLTLRGLRGMLNFTPPSALKSMLYVRSRAETEVMRNVGSACAMIAYRASPVTRLRPARTQPELFHFLKRLIEFAFHVEPLGGDTISSSTSMISSVA